MVLGAPASRVAKTPGWPSVGIFSTRWKPASRRKSIISAQPSFMPRFSAAMEGCLIQVCRRRTDSSWRFSISARMPATSSGARPGMAPRRRPRFPATVAHGGVAAAVRAAAPALCRNSLRGLVPCGFPFDIVCLLGRLLVCGDFLAQSLALAKPGALDALHIVGQSPLFYHQFVEPLFGFFFSVLRVEEPGVVVEGLRSGGELRGGSEPLLGSSHVTGARVGIRQQTRSAVVVKLHVGAGHALQVGNGGGVFTQAEQTFAAAVVHVEHVTGRSAGTAGAVGFDGLGKGVPGFLILFFLKAEIAEFFVISGGGIVENFRFEALHAGTAAKSLEDSGEKAGVRQDFDQQIGAGADGAADENNPEPIALRPALDEVHDGNDLQDDAPRIEKMSQCAALRRVCQRARPLVVLRGLRFTGRQPDRIALQYMLRVNRSVRNWREAARAVLLSFRCASGGRDVPSYFSGDSSCSRLAFLRNGAASRRGASAAAGGHRRTGSRPRRRILFTFAGA